MPQCGQDSNPTPHNAGFTNDLLEHKRIFPSISFYRVGCVFVSFKIDIQQIYLQIFLRFHRVINERENQILISLLSYFIKKSNRIYICVCVSVYTEGSRYPMNRYGSPLQCSLLQVMERFIAIRFQIRWNPTGKRRRGRPKTTWRHSLEKGLVKLGLSLSEAETHDKDRTSWRNSVAAISRLHSQIERRS